jgi:hypothetical protein
MQTKSISKVLSPNDTGDTGGHQSGLLVPKEPQFLSFFPALSSAEHNPRVHLKFTDDAGTRWEFAFIYYNNRLFGGTRNEYRLTRMTKFIREAGLGPGDEIILSNTHAGYRISYRRAKPRSSGGGVLKLGTGWRVVPI